jgi:hypothetical protein
MTKQDLHVKIDALERELPAAAAKAFAAARKRALDSGNSVVESENGNLYEVFPDRPRVMVDKIEPPTPNIPGRKITIR